jgi:CrcB protein
MSWGPVREGNEEPVTDGYGGLDGQGGNGERAGHGGHDGHHRRDGQGGYGGRDGHHRRDGQGGYGGHDGHHGHDRHAHEQIDPDVDLHVPEDRAERLWRVLAVVALGGALGATLRYAATLAWPARPGAFPWTVFWVNVTGCALIGVLMVLVAELRTAHPLVRPFLGTGVLGGFTTFSTYAVDITHLLDAHRAATALAYAAGTMAAALAAVALAAGLTRRVVGGAE